MGCPCAAARIHYEASHSILLLMEHIFTLMTLVALQAVLGFDNLLYISLESKRAPEASQAMVRKLGIGLAIILRIVLLFAVLKMVELLDQPLFGIESAYVTGSFKFDSIIFLAGGLRSGAAKRSHLPVDELRLFLVAKTTENKTNETKKKAPECRIQSTRSA